MLSSSSSDQNIQVVVRIRPRSNKEIKENSHISIESLKFKEINLNLENNRIKTYSFDSVFGPEVDQKTVFNSVVKGMLDQVLSGYNCTIFAYGQTGAGKTFTMEGDLQDVKGPDVYFLLTKAGIIPRTLFELFERLDSDDIAEYSFKVSYVELYNEELKDLLSSDDDSKKLRIFDDANRKGSVLINGLEEVLVKNAHDVLSILLKGSNKRQTAATKMNEMSRYFNII